MLGDLLKKIGWNTLIYGLSGVLQRVISIFLIPVYTHYLSPQDYGTIELLDLTSYIVAMVVGIGLGSAVLRFYCSYTDKAEQNEVISTAVAFLLPASFATFLLLHAMSGLVSRLVFGQEGYRYFVSLVFLALMFSIICGVLMSYIRAKQQAVLYAGFSVLQLGLGLSLNVYLIAGRRMGVLGALYGGAITQAVMAAVLLFLTIHEVRFHFSLQKLRDMLRFGLPLVPAGMSMFVLNFADRFFLRKYSNLGVVGTYALGYKMGMGLSTMLFAPFYLYWSSYLYEVARKENARELFARVQEYLAIGLIFGALGLSLFSQETVRALAPPAYWTAAGIVPIIALAYVFSGFYYYFQLGPVLTKKTKFRAYAATASALVNIALNFLLIRPYGAFGAAWATLLSFLLLAAFSYYFSQRLYRIPYDLAKFAKVAIIASLLFACSRVVQTHSLMASVALHATLLGCFPPALWMANLFGEEEKRMARRTFLMMYRWPGVATK